MPARRQRRIIPDRKPPKPSAVTISRLPVVQCEVCGAQIAYRQDKTTASETLDAHYKKEGHI